MEAAGFGRLSGIRHGRAIGPPGTDTTVLGTDRYSVPTPWSGESTYMAATFPRRRSPLISTGRRHPSYKSGAIDAH